MNATIKIGQRLVYKDGPFNFIAEVIEEPNKYKIVQYFSGPYGIGHVGVSPSSFKDSNWVYLEGQDRPL